MTVQRFKGYAWQCPVSTCRRKFKAETVLVLELQVDEHVTACAAKMKADLERAVAAAAQGELFK